MLTAFMVRMERLVALVIVGCALSSNTNARLAKNLATVQHHSLKKSEVMEVAVQVVSLLRFAYDLTSAENSDNTSDGVTSVTEYVAPAPDVTCAAPACLSFLSLK